MAAARDLDIDPTWKSCNVKRTERITVSQYCPEQPYLEVRVPHDIQVVRCIVFKTLSHDQGFSNEEDVLRGTYKHSFSWFDVVVIGPSGHHRAARRNLQNNAHAVPDARLHINCWDYRHDSPQLLEWLLSIRPGDIVQIIPKARHLCWLNTVLEAEIDIFGEDLSVLGSSPLDINDEKDLFVESTPRDKIYRPLQEQKGEIRLIHLQPGSFGDSLSCVIGYTALYENAVTPYEALSYCWGDPRDKKFISMSYVSTEENLTKECAVAVTRNLYDALQHLQPSNRQARTLWIDAICIDQNDLHERSMQVAMMQQVYAQAKGVVVWLGKSNDLIRKSIQDAKIIMERYNAVSSENSSELDTTKLHAPLLDDGYYMVDSPFFQYDWFRRTWVLQEVFHAATTSVHCGNDVMPWSMVLRLNQCLNRSMLVPNPIGKHVMPSLFAELFQVLETEPSDARWVSTRRSKNLGILDVIVRGLDLDATDPRDKLFALLSFGEETSNTDELPAAIRPDYKKSTAQAFADFTRWWIVTHRSLRVLSAVHLSQGRTWQRLSNLSALVEDPDRASWSLWHDGKSFWARGTLGLSLNAPYSAAGNTLPDYEMLLQAQNPMVLPLRGHIVGMIENRRSYPYYNVVAHTQEPNHPESCQLTALHNAYVNLFDPLNSRGTWTSGIQHNELQTLQRPDNAQELKDKDFDHLRAHYEHAARTGAIACHDACYFRADDGSFGLCPPGAKEKDVIVVLYGGCVPYILRPSQDKPQTAGTSNSQYSFVGECYLQGYMDGRAVEQHEDGSTTLSTHVFELV